MQRSSRSSPRHDDRGEEKLVLAAVDGDRAASQQLLVAQRPHLEAFVRARLGPRLRTRETVEDVVQDALLQAIKAIDSFKWQGDSSRTKAHATFRRWLASVAENVIRNHDRHYFKTGKRAPGNPKKLDDSVYPTRRKGSTEGTRIRQTERFERLERALAGLPQADRTLILMTQIENLPVNEMARRLGLTREATSMRLKRALQKLRRRFGPTDSFSLPRDRSLSAKSSWTGRNRDVRSSSSS